MEKYILENINKPFLMSVFCESEEDVKNAKQKILSVMNQFPDIEQLSFQDINNSLKKNKLSRLKHKNHQHKTLNYIFIDAFDPTFSFDNNQMRMIYMNGRDYRMHVYYIDIGDRNTCMNKIRPNLRTNIDVSI